MRHGQSELGYCCSREIFCLLTSEHQQTWPWAACTMWKSQSHCTRLGNLPRCRMLLEGDVIGKKKKTTTGNGYFCSPYSLPSIPEQPCSWYSVCLMSDNSLACTTVDLITWAYTVTHTDKRMCLFGWGWEKLKHPCIQNGSINTTVTTKCAIKNVWGTLLSFLPNQSWYNRRLFGW